MMVGVLGIVTWRMMSGSDRLQWDLAKSGRHDGGMSGDHIGVIQGGERTQNVMGGHQTAGDDIGTTKKGD